MGREKGDWCVQRTLRTALMAAARSGSIELTRALLDRGADVSAAMLTSSITAAHEAALGGHGPITAANPSGMVFVLRDPAVRGKPDEPDKAGEAAKPDEAGREPGAFLPRELASLHVAGMGFRDEWALAPWAIDDATDLLYEHRARPRDLLWLATGSLAGLFWGLHDWAHFHNHGAFEPQQRAWTELQCDVTALGWAWLNRVALGLEDQAWERARREVMAIGAARFASSEGEIGEPFDPILLDADRVRALVMG